MKIYFVLVSSMTVYHCVMSGCMNSKTRIVVHCLNFMSENEIASSITHWCLYKSSWFVDWKIACQQLHSLWMKKNPNTYLMKGNILNKLIQICFLFEWMKEISCFWWMLLCVVSWTSILIKSATSELLWGFFVEKKIHNP